jgi:hypothetical protein
MSQSEFERNEMAMLFGLVTAAYIAKKNGYSFQDFMRAVMLSWESEKSDPSKEVADHVLGRSAMKETTISRSDHGP